ncbi:hypothetical protein A5320_02625 [Rheinheimera sp. SA_1]|nr:hypothetical protein A5320_02625 [Rheinheimera sp. SA_1]
MFSAIQGYYYKTLPFKDAERLMHLEFRVNTGGTTAATYRDFLDWEERQQSFAVFAAYYPSFATLSVGQSGTRYNSAVVTSNLFEVTGVRPLLGRGFTADDTLPGSAQVVVISDVVWQEFFRKDPSVIGKTLRVNGNTHTVIGVMPTGYRFPVDQYVWIPVNFNKLEAKRRDGIGLEVLGLLKSGVSMAASKSELASIMQDLATQYPETNEGYSAEVKPYTEEFTRLNSFQTKIIIYTLLTASVFVLLIACVNVGNLILAKGAARMRETAIHAALGATRRRFIFRQVLESLIISMGGGVLGVPLGYWLGAWTGKNLLSQAGSMPFWVTYQLDSAVVLFSCVLICTAAMLTGLYPALRSASPNLMLLMKEMPQNPGSAQQVGGRLTLVQISLSFALLYSSVLMLQSGQQINQTTQQHLPGVTATGRVALDTANYATVEARHRFIERLKYEAQSNPQISAFALTTSLPGIAAPPEYYTLGGRAVSKLSDYPVSKSVSVDGAFFAMAGSKLLAGRIIDSRDKIDSTPVVVVNQTFAQQWWPDVDSAIGQKIRVGLATENHPWATIVGVVSDIVHGDVRDEVKAVLYMPLLQQNQSFVSVMASTMLPANTAINALQQMIKSADAEIAAYFLRTLDQAIEQSYLLDALMAKIYSGFASVAVMLSAFGIFGTLSYNLSRQSKELGIRKALGATPKELATMLLTRTYRQYLFGSLIGAVLCVGLGRVMASQIYGVSAFDLTSLVLVFFTLALVVLVASLLPIVRAIKTEPIVALRHV